MTDQVESERILWQAYPSWGQFSWLYFLSLWTASRGMIFLYAEVPGWEIWVVGAGLLLGVAVGHPPVIGQNILSPHDKSSFGMDILGRRLDAPLMI